MMFRTIFYQLLKHPSTLSTLLAEIGAADQKNQLSDPIVTWAQSQQLPYLNACIKEAARIHPPLGLQLERVVPAEGATICGTRFEAGTVVGINPWVAHRDPTVFGEDVEAWRPERWMVREERYRLMEKSLLTVSLSSPHQVIAT